MDNKKHLSLTLFVHTILCYNLAWHANHAYLNLNLMQFKYNRRHKIFYYKLYAILVGRGKAIRY